MTADVTVLRPVLPMTTFLTGNDVPKEYQTRACTAFALWLEQLGDGNAPLALLHMAEALKAEQKRAERLAETGDRLSVAWGEATERLEAVKAWLAKAEPYPELNGNKFAEVRAALSGGVV